MSNKALVSFFLGQVAAGGNPPAERSNVAADNASMAMRVGYQIDIDGWRQYAGRLRANLDARKYSEATLLAELKKANIDHPLAKEEAFTEIFKKNLAERYSVAEQDDEKYGARLNEEQQKSVAIGREAVG